MVLRELLVKLGLDVDAASFAQGELAAKGIEKGLEKLVEWGKEAVHHFVEMIEKTAESAHQLEIAAQSTGLTTKALQELRRAAEFTGVEAEQLDVGLFRLARSMSAAKKGGDEQAATFRKLGVKVTDAHGKLRQTDDVVTDLAAGFAKMPDGLEKTNLAMEVFGRSGARLIPMLNQGREGLAKLREEAFVMSPEQIEAGKEMVLTQKRIAEVTRDLWKRAVAPLLPAITELLKRYLEWRKANAAIMAQRIAATIGYAIKAVNALANAFTFLVKNALAVEVLLASLAAYFLVINAAAVGAALATAAAWALAALPFIAIGAAVTALLLIFDDLRVYAKGGDSLFGRFEKQLRAWSQASSNDPWWLTAIKAFTRMLTDAVSLIKEFNDLMGIDSTKKIDQAAGISAKEMQARIDAGNQAVARKRVAMGLPLTDREKASLGNSGVSPEAFVGKYAGGGGGAPEYNAPAGGGRAPVSVLSAPQMTINAAPGQSVDELRSMVREELQTHTDNLMESTAAAVAQ